MALSNAKAKPSLVLNSGSACVTTIILLNRVKHINGDKLLPSFVVHENRARFTLGW